MIRNQKGFSLIEIMIVLAIIGTIIGMIAQRIFGAREKANYKQVKIVMQQIMSQLDMYQSECMTYPSSSQGLEALVKQPTGSPECESWGPTPYLRDVPKDPWGQPFQYESDGIEYEIISYAGDKRPGGEGAGKDISSKDL